ncbi:hypothetical protein BYT27DRAFT_7205914 [Phlegmacium glaucopus]|nr:hypothetical protein BYT27DRAFT_7203529 [Phlegmacium glaucopus]KAF8814603.1 hypothetical protein BYT27DRAFT_7205914 [Phlegmacium glaucopus]
MTVKFLSGPIMWTALGLMFAGGPSYPWKIIVVILELFRDLIQNHPNSQPLALDTKVVIYYRLMTSYLPLPETHDLEIVSANSNLHNFDKK